jgi:hypothetical protein
MRLCFWSRKNRDRSTASKARTDRPRRRTALPLCIESLEDRLTPSTFTVVNVNDSGSGSLRAAITSANASTGNLLKFSIPGRGVHTINLLSPLPAIAKDNTHILGDSQPGYRGKPLIELDGALAGPADGLLIKSASNCEIEGLSIYEFDVYGIEIFGSGAHGNSIHSNYIGLKADGVTPLPNAIGVALDADVTGNTVGGTAPGAGNVISGNSDTGVLLDLCASNFVQGNKIGTNAAGTAALPNQNYGVDVRDGSANNLIGGTTAGAGNLVSGNHYTGVLLTDAGTVGNQVQGNMLGTDVTGNLSVSNFFGVAIINSAGGNLIGGTVPGAGNLISGNTGSGVYVAGYTTTLNLMQGNRIGTNAAGTAALPNSDSGVTIESGAYGNVVGGAGAGNFISGNMGAGVRITGGGTNANLVSNNHIGTATDGFSPVGNLIGVQIAKGASNNVVGGAQGGNIIAHNSSAGVAVTDNTSLNNLISQNAIDGNGGPGIDLGNDGVTSNSFGGPHVGPNLFQNKPVLVSASTPGLVTGTYNSTPNSTFTLEFFANPSAALGSPPVSQGKDYLGSLKVTTDAAGNAPFSFSFTPVPGEPTITATATDSAGNTSEFAAGLDAGLTGFGFALSGTVGVNFAGTVAAFSDADAQATSADFLATISWGDFQETPGTVVAGVNNAFSIAGSHTYTGPATLLPITVTIVDKMGNTQATAHSTMSLVTGFTGVAKTLAYTESTSSSRASQVVASASDQSGALASLNQVVATFFDADPHAFAGLYTATIDWGDAAAGSPADTSPGSVRADGSGFDVSGAHAYAKAGTYPVNVTVQDAFGGSVVIHSTAVVNLAPLSVQSVTFPVTGNKDFSGTVAVITDPDPRSDPTFYTATVT